MTSTLPFIEIILYYSVILASPIIYILYLKRNKKIRRDEIRKNVVIFGSFYALIALLGAYAFLKD